MAEVKKQKWEIKFEEYKNAGLMDKKIEDLEKQLREDNSEYARRLAEIIDTNSNEYRAIVSERKERQKQTEKIKKIMTNMPKIERLKNLRDSQQAKLQKLLLEKEDNKREVEGRKRLQDKSQKLETQLRELQEKSESLNKILNSPESTEKQKEEARARLEENKIAQDKNQAEYSSCMMLLEERNKYEITNISDKEIQAVKTIISKCNFACRLLMEGKNIDDVQVSLSQWQDRKLTKKKEVKETEQKEIKTVEQKEEKESEVAEKSQPIAEVEKEEKAESLPVQVSEFAKKHPKLAAMGNWFKNTLGNIKDRFSKKDKEAQKSAELSEGDKKEIATVVEKVKEEEKSKEDKNSFKASIVVTSDKTKKQTVDEMNARKVEYYARMAEKGRLGTTVQEDLEKQRNNGSER